MQNQDLKAVMPEATVYCLEKLQNKGFKAYVVGGCVRDALLGLAPHDWDITTSAKPHEIKEVFASNIQIDTGIKHGTVMVIIGREIAEITTFRVDGEYRDNRRPVNVSFTTEIEEDLYRRDFTINAIALDSDGLIDPFGGKPDLEEGIIRCVGDPYKRFNEDALRILRGLRFSSTLGFKVDNVTKKAMSELKSLLSNISQERKTSEFVKALCGRNIHDTMIGYSDIITELIPEIKNCIGFDQRNRYHVYNVYDHTALAVSVCPSDSITRTSMFFHDIGKPATSIIDENGIGHFYGHPEVSASIAEGTLRRMKFSTSDIKLIKELVLYHDYQVEASTRSVRRLLNKIGEQQFLRLLDMKTADTIAQNPLYTERRLAALKNVEEVYKKMTGSDAAFSLKDLSINGNDLLSLGVREGRDVGMLLSSLLEMVINEELGNTRQELLEKAREIIRSNTLRTNALHE